MNKKEVYFLYMGSGSKVFRLYNINKINLGKFGYFYISLYLILEEILLFL